MSKALVVLFLLIVVGVGAYVLYFAPAANANFGTVTIGSPGKIFRVEIADTEPKRAQGLSGRSSIGSDGMLFVFDAPAKHQFWMKDMKFPLDFIWIKDDRVIGVDMGVQTPKSGQDPGETKIEPASEVNYVLEVPVGFAKQYLIEIGTQVSIVSHP